MCSSCVNDSSPTIGKGVICQFILARPVFSNDKINVHITTMASLPDLSCHKGSGTVSHSGNGSFLHAWGFPGRQSEERLSLDHDIY